MIWAVGCGRLGFGERPPITGDDASAAADVAAPRDGAPDGSLADAALVDAVAPIPIGHTGQWTVTASQLAHTPAAVTSRQIFTIATWYRSTNIAEMLLCAGISAQQQTFLWADMTDGKVLLQHQEIANQYVAAPGMQAWAYHNLWVHLVVAVDLTQAAPDARVRWWLDGVPQIIDPDTTPGFAQGQEVYLGDTALHTIGNKYDGSYNWTGALAETYIIWGHALDPSSFITGTGAATRSIAYTGPVTPESVYFDYAVPGVNGFAGQPSWDATQISTSVSDLPY